MAMELRFDADALETADSNCTVSQLRTMSPAMRSRALHRFLKENGVLEPERSHIRALESLVFSIKPSAQANLPGAVTIARNYDRLELLKNDPTPEAVELRPGQTLQLPQWGFEVSCVMAEEIINTKEIFTVNATEPVVMRPRQVGDSIRLNAGTCTLKKLFIDRKIPANRRDRIPVFSDAQGVLGVGGIGANVDRLAHGLPALQIRLKPLEIQR